MKKVKGRRKGKKENHFRRRGKSNQGADQKSQRLR